jgi:hypothetical protein
MNYSQQTRLIWTITICLLLVGLSTRCAETDPLTGEPLASRPQQAIDACVGLGGIPVLDDRWILTECVFPPQECSCVN